MAAPALPSPGAVQTRLCSVSARWCLPPERQLTAQDRVTGAISVEAHAVDEILPALGLIEATCGQVVALRRECCSSMRQVREHCAQQQASQTLPPVCRCYRQLGNGKGAGEQAFRLLWTQHSRHLVMPPLTRKIGVAVDGASDLSRRRHGDQSLEARVGDVVEQRKLLIFAHPNLIVESSGIGQ